MDCHIIEFKYLWHPASQNRRISTCFGISFSLLFDWHNTINHVYLLLSPQLVSAYYFGDTQIVPQLGERNCSEVQASPLQNSTKRLYNLEAIPSIVVGKVNVRDS